MSKILIIEDEPIVAEMYRRMFTMGKLDAEIVSNGEKGLAKAKEIKPDLILLDVMMPYMNGLDVLEELKKDPDIKQTPIVVMLSNINDQETMDKAYKLGASGYLIKSAFDSDKLLDEIKSYLK